MHLFHIPQCSTQNRNVHIYVLIGALWGMEQVHSGICDISLFIQYTHCSFDMLSHWGLNKTATSLQMKIFSQNASFVFLFKFHWSLLLRIWVTINQHWSRRWLGAYQATKHIKHHTILILNTRWFIFGKHTSIFAHLSYCDAAFTANITQSR